MAANIHYNEPELLFRMKSGDKQAFRQFFDTYWKRVYSNARQFTRDAEQAKDLAQDVFIKIWLNKEKLSQVISLEHYLYAVSRNLFLDTLKKRVTEVPANAFLNHHSEDGPHAADKKVELKELEESLLRIINELPPQMQTVFRLSRMEGLTHKQIAARMHISKATSQSYIVRALGIIRNAMSKKMDFVDIFLILPLTELIFF